MESTPATPVVIAPRRGWVGPGLRELWEHRDLGFFLVWRDLKVRYKQTVLGVAWAVLQPLAMMVVFAIFLGQIPGIAPEGVPYALFALAGLVPWTLFSQSLIGASNSLVNSQSLISKVYFPRLLLPIAGVGSFVVDFFVALILLLIATPLFGYPLTLTILWLPVFALFAVLAALAVGTWLSSLNARYRDVRHVVPFLVQLWLFASPVAYSITLVPENLRPLFALNPMAGVIAGFRWALLGGDPPNAAILVSALVTLLILVGGIAYFRRVERSFADTI
jgi:lipopolysaccharide transport system permease protein